MIQRLRTRFNESRGLCKPILARGQRAETSTREDSRPFGLEAKLAEGLYAVILKKSEGTV
jgi:hypothetical protein